MHFHLHARLYHTDHVDRRKGRNSFGFWNVFTYPTAFHILSAMYEPSDNLSVKVHLFLENLINFQTVNDKSSIQDNCMV